MVRKKISIKLSVALKNLDEKFLLYEEGNDPIDRMRYMNDPRKVVRNVEETGLDIDNHGNLSDVECEKKSEDEKMDEAEDCCPVAPFKWKLPV